MAQKRSYIVLILFLFCTLSMSCAKTDKADPKAEPLKLVVLVLPLQAGQGVPADKVSLGLAVQAVLEHVLGLSLALAALQKQGFVQTWESTTIHLLQ